MAVVPKCLMPYFCENSSIKGENLHFDHIYFSKSIYKANFRGGGAFFGPNPL